VSQPDDPEDASDRDTVWTLTLEHADGTVESRLLTVAKSDEPFNHDGFWKAILVAPEDGFVCALGTEEDEATVCRDVARDCAEGIEA
jgi:hypothetical protein